MKNLNFFGLSQKHLLCYESITHTSKKLSSPIFQSLSVSESVREASVTPDLTWVFVYILYLCICVFSCLCIYVFAAVWWPRKDLKQRRRKVPKNSHFGYLLYFVYYIYVFAAVWWPRKGLKERWRRVLKNSHFGYL